MMQRLRAAVRPLVSSSMTTDELLREAEAAFPNPTPLVALMMQRLGHVADVASKAGTEKFQPIDPDEPLHCPQCGAQLHFEE